MHRVGNNMDEFPYYLDVGKGFKSQKALNLLKSQNLYSLKEKMVNSTI